MEDEFPTFEARPALYDEVYNAIKDAILHHHLGPGTRLTEIELSKRLGVSRTPVREAIRRLGSEGFVTILPRKGAIVTSLSLEGIREIYEIREALESQAARLAAVRGTEDHIRKMQEILDRYAEAVKASDTQAIVDLDTEFHATLFEASGNTRMGRMIQTVREQARLLRRRSVMIPERSARSLAEKVEFMKALVARDGERAAHLMRLHVESVKNDVIKANG
ncbi:MAG: GntR family transcriptional regulator [Bacillota bacterium]